MLDDVQPCPACSALRLRSMGTEYGRGVWRCAYCVRRMSAAGGAPPKLEGRDIAQRRREADWSALRDKARASERMRPSRWKRWRG